MPNPHSKPQLLVVFFLIAAVSCDRVRMLWKDNMSPQVDIYCKNWDKSTGTCIECYEGCTKWEDICVKIVEHCASWSDQGDCVTCQTGYGTLDMKSINGTCPKQSTSQPKTTNQNTQTQAQPPKKGSSLGSHKKSPQLPLVDIHCQCHTQDRECIDCFNGYYLDANSTCQQLPENCTTANEMGDCTACVTRYAVENGTCVLQECDFALCTSFNKDQTVCTGCSYRSYLDNGCCVLVNGFCSNWVESTGECTGCYQGYVIDPTNKKQCIAQ